jgi:alpha-1,6-mannosyltransferase
VHVHISNLAAQTGASLFQQTHAPPFVPHFGVYPPTPGADWVYNKTEDVSPAVITANRAITHVIAEVHDHLSSDGKHIFEATGFPGGSWVVTAVVAGFERWKINLGAVKLEPMKPWKVLEYVERERLVVLERKGW